MNVLNLLLIYRLSCPWARCGHDIKKCPYLFFVFCNGIKVHLSSVFESQSGEDPALQLLTFCHFVKFQKALVRSTTINSIICPQCLGTIRQGFVCFIRPQIQEINSNIKFWILLSYCMINLNKRRMCATMKNQKYAISSIIFCSCNLLDGMLLSVVLSAVDHHYQLFIVVLNRFHYFIMIDQILNRNIKFK